MSIYNTDPRDRYDGPEFDEYCIDKSGYLPACRDRSPCLDCSLNKLCQAGFDEQVKRVIAGVDPSLTKDCELTAQDLTWERLLEGLSPEAAAFVVARIGRSQR